jgi:hypothetical protein
MLLNWQKAHFNFHAQFYVTRCLLKWKKLTNAKWSKPSKLEEKEKFYITSKYANIEISPFCAPLKNCNRQTWQIQAILVSDWLISKKCYWIDKRHILISMLNFTSPDVLRFFHNDFLYHHAQVKIELSSFIPLNSSHVLPCWLVSQICRYNFEITSNIL